MLFVVCGYICLTNDRCVFFVVFSVCLHKSTVSVWSIAFYVLLEIYGFMLTNVGCVCFDGCPRVAYAYKCPLYFVH